MWVLNVCDEITKCLLGAVYYCHVCEHVVKFSEYQSKHLRCKLFLFTLLCTLCVVLHAGQYIWKHSYSAPVVAAFNLENGILRKLLISTVATEALPHSDRLAIARTVDANLQ